MNKKLIFVLYCVSLVGYAQEPHEVSTPKQSDSRIVKTFSDISFILGGVSRPLRNRRISMAAEDALKERQLSFIRGGRLICHSITGVYNYRKRNGEEGKFKFWYPKRYKIPVSDHFQQVAWFEDQNAPEGQKDGMAIMIDDKWYLIEPKKDISQTRNKRRYLVQLAFSEDSLVENNNIDVIELDFTDDMLSAESEDYSSFSFDSRSSIDDYYSSRNTRTRLPSLLKPNRNSIRIPPEMYSLIDNPDFQRAKSNRDFSSMYDMIYSRALELADGDITKALFISLITIDLRDRGPCGAIAGLRGRVVVPQSIFDGEVFPDGTPHENRLDAAQHFFGYAILSRGISGGLLKPYSAISKSQADRKFFRFFRYLHEVELDFDRNDPSDKAFPFGPATLVEGQDMRLRENYDVKSDIHYNRLGIDFGRRLQEDEGSKPSDILNDEKYFKFDREMLTMDRQTSVRWSASYDLHFVSCLKKGMRYTGVGVLNAERRCDGLNGTFESSSVQQCSGQTHREGFIRTICRKLNP